MNCKSSVRQGCAPLNREQEASFDDLKSIVRHYLAHRATAAEEYLDHQRVQKNYPAAVDAAAMAIGRDGKRFSHQRRIPLAALRRMRDFLLAQQSAVRKCADFDSLLMMIEQGTHDIAHIGPLTVYDTAHRLGAYLGLRPDYVYLHADTSKGAKALGLNHKIQKLPRSSFPKEFGKLLPEQIEDCLCIYKRALMRIHGTGPR